MKNLTLFVGLFAFLIVGCTSDDQQPKGGSLETIHLDDIRNLLPETLLSNTTAVFKDASGAERRFNVVYQDTFLMRSLDGQEYTHEQLAIGYYDDNKPGFRMNIFGIGLYTSDLHPQYSITALLMPGNSSGNAIVDIEVENGINVINPYPFDLYHTSLDILLETFNDVYVGININEEITGFSEIMLNLHKGIVGFRDVNDDLWAFDRFE